MFLFILRKCLVYSEIDIIYKGRNCVMFNSIRYYLSAINSHKGRTKHLDIKQNLMQNNGLLIRAHFPKFRNMTRKLNRFKCFQLAF